MTRAFAVQLDAKARLPSAGATITFSIIDRKISSAFGAE